MDACAEAFKILVVDDSPLYRKLVEQSLSPQQYSVVFAKNGGEALALFGEHQPSVVITDWSMPDISGPELCQRLRRDFHEIHTHIILLTSNTDKQQVVEGLAAGADDYLTKPFHPGELLARVGVGCRLVELHRQVHAKNRLLEGMALTDHLTGLPNRRAIDVWATRQLSAAIRHDFPVWVVMADLDRFKTINDAHGHAAGDIVLQRFAEVLNANTRRSDMCARLGGEEFLLVLGHVKDKQGVAIAIEKIRKQFENQKFTFGNSVVTATASFGVAEFHGVEPPDLNTLIADADKALYAAKHKGRNRMEFAE